MALGGGYKQSIHHRQGLLGKFRVSGDLRPDVERGGIERQDAPGKALFQLAQPCGQLLAAARVGGAQLEDVSGAVPALTGCTWADLLAGKHGCIAHVRANQFLRNVEGDTARWWLVSVEQHLREFSEQRAVRNPPGPFLPKDGVSLLGVRGLHCALATWLKVHGAEKASPEQWYSRISNLTAKGLREEELVLSCMVENLDCESSSAVTGDAMFTCLSYEALR